jgi:hypothetical protein
MDRVGQKCGHECVKRRSCVKKDYWNDSNHVVGFERCAVANIVFYSRSYVVEIKFRKISCLSISFDRYHAFRHPKSGSPRKGERPYVSHGEMRSDHFWGTRSGEPSSVKVFHGDDIRSHNFRPGKPEKSVLKLKSLVTRALTQEEPQLHVQPGAARGDVSRDWRKQSDKVWLTHCRETDAYFGSRRRVYYFQQMRFSLFCREYLAHDLGSGRREKERKGRRSCEQFMPLEPMHGFLAACCFFQSNSTRSRALGFFEHISPTQSPSSLWVTRCSRPSGFLPYTAVS